MRRDIGLAPLLLYTGDNGSFTLSMLERIAVQLKSMLSCSATRILLLRLACHILSCSHSPPAMYSADAFSSLVLKPFVDHLRDMCRLHAPQRIIMLEVIARHIFQHSDAIQRDIALLSTPDSIEAVERVALPAKPHALHVHDNATDHCGAGLLRVPSVSKFDTFVYPSGNIRNFHEGLATRIGFPHLQFRAAMFQEHCKLAGCKMQFTSRNYDITTCPEAEWAAVVDGQAPPPENMRHGRIIPSGAG